MQGFEPMHAMQAARVTPVRVFVVAPAIVCWGLERLVQTAHPRIELAGSAPGAQAAREVLRRNPADVVLVVHDTDEDIAEIIELATAGNAKCLFLSGAHDDSLADKAMLSGARGVVHTWGEPGTLLKAIEKVAEGELWIDRGATSRIFLAMARQKAAEGRDPEKTKIASLTQRERQAIVAVAGDAAAPAKVIARRLCISEHTLRNHLTSIYSKLEVTNRLDLYAYATRHHLNEMR
jgi:two-component system, NarL family, nitrate/nitrite response regulator NarL